MMSRSKGAGGGSPAVPPVDDPFWDGYGRHVKQALRRAREFESEGWALGEPLVNLANFHAFQGRLDEAEELLQEALGAVEQVEGPVSVEAAIVRVEWAWLRIGEERASEIGEILASALPALAIAVAPPARTMAQACICRAEALRALGEMEQADGVHVRAIPWLEDPSGDIPDGLLGDALLAQVRHLFRQRRVHEALGAVQRAQDLYVKEEGPWTHRMAGILCARAVIEEGAGEPGMAILSFRRALRIARRLDGPDALFAAEIEEAIARFYGHDAMTIAEEAEEDGAGWRRPPAQWAMRPSLEAAERWAKKALAHVETHYGEESVETARLHGFLMCLFHLGRRTDKAMSRQCTAVDILERAKGPDRPDALAYDNALDGGPEDLRRLRDLMR
ncbi:MAG TPA: tetratricopeptide repeat protein [Armatimonadota bacterium]|jgi:tetratricopeptide (TPR) repeat protein